MPPRHSPGPEARNKPNKNMNKRLTQANMNDMAQTENFKLGKIKRILQEDSGPAFPGARFPLSAVPATTSSHSRAYSLTHNAQGKLVDNLNAPADQTTRRYIGAKPGGTGIWKNTNGAQIGRSLAEDATIMPSKSTGDLPPTGFGNAIHIHLHSQPAPLNTQKAAKLKNKQYKGKAGY